jgi:hypothetical protein
MVRGDYKYSKQKTDKLMREDIVVLGGANDIRKNASTDGLKHISVMN